MRCMVGRPSNYVDSISFPSVAHHSRLNFSNETDLSARHPDIYARLFNEWIRIGKEANAPVDFGGDLTSDL